jgi:hypothetical protein
LARDRRRRGRYRDRTREQDEDECQTGGAEHYRTRLLSDRSSVS